MKESESRYRDWLDARASAGLLRELKSVEDGGDGTVAVDDTRYVNFSGNDYLGLSHDPRLVERARDWAGRYGAGAGASRLVTGNLTLFEGIERKVAHLKRRAAALVMASGFQTNAGVIQALLDAQVLGGEPLVFADRLNHSSMHFGCQAAGVRQHRYRHCDAGHLASLLNKHRNSRQPRFILTESVFSMDGDVAPIDDIVELARDHDAIVICDDAHATGVLGEGGQGLSGESDIVIGTFSKALGSYGAYVACSQGIRDYLINRCTGLIYSTALPPPLLGAIDAALDLIPDMDQERAHVAGLAASLRQKVSEIGFDTGTSTTQIVPVMTGDADSALSLSARLRDAGYWVTPIRPPTVPKGSARLRLSFSAIHTHEQVDGLVDILARTRTSGYATV